MGRGKKPLILGALLCGLFMWANAQAATVDTVYTNGKIYPLDDIKSGDTYDFSKVKDLDGKNIRTVEVVAVKDGKIVFAGSRADAQAQGMLNAKKTVNLQGRAMLPGFIDGHGHFHEQGSKDLYKLDLGSPPLGTMTSIDDYIEALNKACENARPGDGVLATGYDDTLITDMRHPTWEDIEGAPACKGKDVQLRHISDHAIVVSKSLLVQAGLMTEDGTPTQKALDTPGVVISNGKVTGVLMETQAMTSVATPKVKTDDQKSLGRANEVYLSRGVTMADAGGAVLMPGEDFIPHNVTFQTGLDNGNLTLRVNIHPLLNFAYGGLYNLMSCYWAGNIDPTTITSFQDLEKTNFAPTGYTPKIGEDITKKAFAFTAYYTPPDTLPDNYLFMGAYKILGDGSPQAYTAWMKDPGNYDWGDYTAEDSFAWHGNVDGKSPIWGTKYYTMEDSAAPTPPPYFDGLPGTVNVYPKELQAILEVLHRNGQSTEIHTNGSAYAEAWMEALEMTVSKHPEIKDTRHTSIHAQTFERNMFERMSGRYSSVDRAMTTQLFGALGQPDRGQPGTVFDSSAVNGMNEAQLSEAMKAQNLFANFFVTHTYFYGERHRDIFFGPGRANNISPVGWSIALDVPYAFHNDTIVTPIDPLQSMESAITRLSAKSLVSPGGQEINGTGHNLDATVTYPSRFADGAPIPGSEMKFYNYDQRINPAQALLGVTLGPVYQNKIDHLTGTIETGKFADFVILDSDPIEVGEIVPTRMSDIRVTTVIVNGKPAYGILPGATKFFFNVRSSLAPSPKLPIDQAIDNKSIKLTKIPDNDKSELVPVERGYTRYGAYNVTCELPAGMTTATLQMHILGNNSKTGDFQLYLNGEHEKPATYGMSAEPGHFWITTMAAPTVPLDQTETMTMNGDYIVNFTLGASGTTRAGDTSLSFSLQPIAKGGKPTNYSPVSLQTGNEPENPSSPSTPVTPAEPSNPSNPENPDTPGNPSAPADNNSWDSDDSSGGCTIGSRPAWDFALLALAFFAVTGFRALRRRFQA